MGNQKERQPFFNKDGKGAIIFTEKGWKIGRQNNIEAYHRRKVGEMETDAIEW